METILLSPIEVLADVVKTHTSRDVVQHVVVGPLNHEQQREGAASLMDAGERKEQDCCAVYPRVQIRCVAPSLTEVERIGRHVAFALNAIRGRVVGVQGSTDERYLVHSISVNGGPSAHQDTSETWEYLVFIEAMIGVTPL